MSHGDKAKVGAQKIQTTMQRWRGEDFSCGTSGIFPFRVRILVWFVEVVVWGPSFCVATLSPETLLLPTDCTVKSMLFTLQLLLDFASAKRNKAWGWRLSLWVIIFAWRRNTANSAWAKWINVLLFFKVALLQLQINAVPLLWLVLCWTVVNIGKLGGRNSAYSLQKSHYCSPFSSFSSCSHHIYISFCCFFYFLLFFPENRGSFRTLRLRVMLGLPTCQIRFTANRWRKDLSSR